MFGVGADWGAFSSTSHILFPYIFLVLFFQGINLDVFYVYENLGGNMKRESHSNFVWFFLSVMLISPYHYLFSSFSMLQCTNKWGKLFQWLSRSALMIGAHCFDDLADPHYRLAHLSPTTDSNNIFFWDYNDLKAVSGCFYALNGPTLF